jgi:hypothetical protein
VALARSLLRKGADFAAAMAFQFASTNLVVELGILRGRRLDGRLLWAADRPGPSRPGFRTPSGEDWFLGDHGALSTIWGALVGPLVAIISFV